MVKDTALSLAASKGAAALATVSALAAEGGIGISLQVWLLSAVGALMALAYTKPQPQRRRFALLTATVACAVIGAGLAVAVPHIPGLGWTQAIPSPVRGLLTAFCCQFALPLAIEELPAYITRLRERLGGK